MYSAIYTKVPRVENVAKDAFDLFYVQHLVTPFRNDGRAQHGALVLAVLLHDKPPPLPAVPVASLE